MKVKDVFVLKEAVDDLNEGRSFYDLQESGVGNYFWDCLIADIESLIIHAGIHTKLALVIPGRKAYLKRHNGQRIRTK
jgi:hypothetical protein